MWCNEEFSTFEECLQCASRPVCLWYKQTEKFVHASGKSALSDPPNSNSAIVSDTRTHTHNGRWMAANHRAYLYHTTRPYTIHTSRAYMCACVCVLSGIKSDKTNFSIVCVRHYEYVYRKRTGTVSTIHLRSLSGYISSVSSVCMLRIGSNNHHLVGQYNFFSSFRANIASEFTQLKTIRISQT